MNDMTFQCDIEIDRSGGLAGTDIGELNQPPRRTINWIRAAASARIRATTRAAS